MNQHTLEVYIEELILHGFSTRDRYSIGAAVEMELSRLFTEQGLPSSFYNGNKIPSLNAGSFQLQRTEGAAGTQIANAVYTSLTDSQ